MDFSGLWMGVLRVILGRRRGANGRFCREIPGFLGGVRARRGDSAHGGYGRANWAKNFLKNFKNRPTTPHLGGGPGPGHGRGAPYIGCAGRFLGLESSKSGC